jgi:ubiquitin C-terminal hydrolase
VGGEAEGEEQDDEGEEEEGEEGLMGGDACAKEEGLVDVHCNFSKRLLLARLPEVLCLHLQRLFGDTYISTHVDYPFELDLGFLSVARQGDYAQQMWYSGGVPEAGGQTGVPPVVSLDVTRMRYELAAVVVHLGTANSGHFVTFRRLSTAEIVSEGEGEGDGRGGTGTDKRGGERRKDLQRWVYCSDRHIRPSSLEEALGQRAYLLFYERLI